MPRLASSANLRVLLHWEACLPVVGGSYQAEIVHNTMPRSRQRATLHHDPQYDRIRNHLVDYLVARSAELSHGRAPEHPPTVRPGMTDETSAEVVPLSLRRTA